MTTGTLFYQSKTCGMDNPIGNKNIAYFGVTYRIPQSEHSCIRQIEWEQSPDELLKPIILPNGQTVTPTSGGTIERIETLDQTTGDLLVMYRIPYQTAG